MVADQLARDNVTPAYIAGLSVEANPHSSVKGIGTCYVPAIGIGADGDACGRPQSAVGAHAINQPRHGKIAVPRGLHAERSGMPYFVAHYINADRAGHHQAE